MKVGAGTSLGCSRSAATLLAALCTLGAAFALAQPAAADDGTPAATATAVDTTGATGTAAAADPSSTPAATDPSTTPTTPTGDTAAASDPTAGTGTTAPSTPSATDDSTTTTPTTPTGTTDPTATATTPGTTTSTTTPPAAGTTTPTTPTSGDASTSTPTQSPPPAAPAQTQTQTQTIVVQVQAPAPTPEPPTQSITITDLPEATSPPASAATPPPSGPSTPVAAAVPAPIVAQTPVEPQMWKHRAKPAPAARLVTRAQAALTPLDHAAVTKLLAHSTLVTTPTAPLAPSKADFVPQQGVTLVPNSEVPVASSGADSLKMLAPPRAPTWPPAPSTPSNDTPGSLGGALNGPVGGALLLFAAIAAVLSIIPPWFTSRVTMAVAAPVEWRRRLSLERPG